MPAKLIQRAAALLRVGRDLEAKLALAAAVTRIAATVDVRPIVTGGTSVDFYAARTVDTARTPPPSWVPSLDLDMVNLAVDAHGAARQVRAQLFHHGFGPAGGKTGPEDVAFERGWAHPLVPIPVEVLGKEFDGSRKRLMRVDVNGGTLWMRGPEDTLWEHIEWGWHVNDQRSWTRALAIAAAQRERLDLPYLRKLAAPLHYEDALDRCLRGEPLRRRAE